MATVIAECGSCHDGSLDKAYELVLQAKACGADVVKFQWWSSHERMARRRHAQDYSDVYRRYGLPFAWVEKLKARADAVGIEFMCSTYLPEDVDEVAPLVKRLKVASFEANSLTHLVAHISHVRAGKHVLVSCGLRADRHFIYEWLIRPGVNAAGSGHVALLHCVSSYPAPVDQLGLDLVGDTLVVHSNGPYTTFKGYSDHAGPDVLWTGAFAAARGAQYVERHMRLADTDPQNPDAPHAMAPHAFADYVHNVRFAEAACRVPEAFGCEAEMSKYKAWDGGGMRW
jgi:N,N'-diacetyllegionaminate synthase